MTNVVMSYNAFARLAGLTLKAQHDGVVRPPHWENDAHKWLVTLRRNDNPAGFDLDFFMGLGHNPDKGPDLSGVLDCLSSDAASIENNRNFEEWAGDFGYDTDSRKAEGVYNACAEEAARLKDWLGDDLYRIFLYDCNEDGDD